MRCMLTFSTFKAGRCMTSSFTGNILLCCNVDAGCHINVKFEVHKVSKMWT